MSRIAYVNGRYVPHRAASVHIEDRGYQFADGVYEVVAVVNGRLIDNQPHLDRLERSLQELALAKPMARRPLGMVMAETARRNRVQNGIVYVQVTRGVAPRNHAFPKRVQPALVVTSRRMTIPRDAESVAAARVVTAPDIRWKRCDIKSVALLGNVLAKEYAVTKGADETWQVDGDGYVTEGSATNAWILDRDGRLVTRPTSDAILGGITRQTLIRLARDAGIEVVERPFTVKEARAAREAFFTSTTNFVKPVGEIDDVVIGNGAPGETSRRLLGLYIAYAQCGHGEANA